MTILVASQHSQLHATKEILFHLQKQCLEVISEDERSISSPVFKMPQGIKIVINRCLNFDYQDNDLKTFFKLKNLQFINSLSATSKYRYKPNSIQNLKKYFPQTHKLMAKINSTNLSYPLFLKPNIGLKGSLIQIIENKQQLESIRDKLVEKNDLEYHLQAGVRIHREWRVLVLNNKIYTIILKKNALDFGIFPLSETGGEVLLNNQNVNNYLKRLMSEIDCFYYALDIIENDKGEFYLVDLNLSPGFKEIDQLTQQSFAKEFVRELSATTAP